MSLQALLTEPWFKATCYAVPILVWAGCMAFCSLTFKPRAGPSDGLNAPLPLYERLAMNPIPWHLGAWTVIALVLEVLL